MSDYENVPKVDAETAADDFERFARAARIKMDRVRNVNDRKDLEEDRQFFIEEVMDGRIVVDNEGIVTVKTDSEDLPEVRFPRRVNAMALVAQDRRKEGENMEKLVQMISAATKAPAGKLKLLDAPDFKNVGLVFSLFLAD